MKEKIQKLLGLRDMNTNEEFVTIPKEQFDWLLYKSNIELLQRVNHLVNLIETEIEKAQEK
jgi:hypothetical protein